VISREQRNARSVPLDQALRWPDNPLWLLPRFDQRSPFRRAQCHLNGSRSRAYGELRLRSVDLRNEWGLVLLPEVDYSWNGGDKIFRQVGMGQFPDEKEECKPGTHCRVALDPNAADFLVAAKGQPSVPANSR
jgi:hypothetical protein